MARVIAVYGPTASGKSAAALTLAGRLDAGHGHEGGGEALALTLEPGHRGGPLGT